VDGGVTVSGQLAARGSAYASDFGGLRWAGSESRPHEGGERPLSLDVDGGQQLAEVMRLLHHGGTPEPGWRERALELAWSRPREGDR